MGYVLWLHEIGREHRTEAGGKAATLGELARAGFPVPKGFVLTTAAFQAFRANGLAEQATTEASVLEVPLPGEIEDALRTGSDQLGRSPLAVRSSAVAEDLVDASFAGQYETVLGVEGIDGLTEAVRHCWASCFSERVTTYRREKGHSESPSMAVLVQRLVTADAAGVAFSANPVTGSRDEVIVSAVRGLGDRLVSGQVSPDEWTVKGDVAECMSSPEGAIDSGQALAVAELARQVEQHFKTPQDIEWAMAGQTLHLLQARPITALPEPPVEPVPISIEPPPGFWAREASHTPRPLHPIMRSFFLDPEGMPAAFYRTHEELGLLIESLEMREIGGWPYARMVPLGGKDLRPPPRWLMPAALWLMARLVPAVRRRMRNAAGFLRTDRAGQYAEQWSNDWRPSLKARIAELRSLDLPALSDEDLGRHLTILHGFMVECADIHMKIASCLLVSLGELAFACRHLLGWDDGRMLELLAGLSEKSSEPSRCLGELADLARRRPEVRILLEQTQGKTLPLLKEADAKFAAAFDAYLNEYGRRALTYDIADPTLAESPDLVLQLVRDQVFQDYNSAEASTALGVRRGRAAAEAQDILRRRSSSDLEDFQRLVARAQQAYPLREDSEFYTVSAPLALVRHAALELGRRLAERGLFARRDDVFFMELDEALSALSGWIDSSDLVTRRKGERKWVELHPGPASYGNDPGPPPSSFVGLPREARFMHEALMWMMERVFAFQTSSKQTGGGDAFVQGITASPGRYTGPVRVIMTEMEFDKLRPGDVLVCPITSPVWSVLFPSVGALVTDSGGVLSHSAIIAREYGIPAVVATGNATSLLRDGQVVTADGNRGVVETADLAQTANLSEGGDR